MATDALQSPVEKPSVQASNLLTWSLLGRFLKWKHSRTAMQIPLLLLAALIVFDGFVGPQLAPKNIATTTAWIHYRGLVVLVLLVAGNLFCMACPFMLPRKIGKHLARALRRGGAGRPWPRWLRSKWLAVALLLLFFWAYEYFDFWASPLWTAWIAAGYFLAAFVIDTVFQGAAFCKYVCPLGQFNLVHAMNSPLEIKVRDHDRCAACQTKDCIQGRDDIPGCELWLFQERKVGNMDCTFCLDCVHACPYDNVGLVARRPAQELWNVSQTRSGLGRFDLRPDLAALIVVLTFGALINAFGMVPPVYALQRRLAEALGTGSEAVVLTLVFVTGMVLLPLGLLAATSALSRRLSSSCESLLQIGTRYAFALVPVSFGMWTAHYIFHFLTGALTIVPVTQDFLRDFGVSWLGEPRWGLGSLVPSAWILPIEMLFLYAGILGSLVAGLQIAQRRYPDRRLALRAALPWLVLVMLIGAASMWLLSQPMEMRGTFMAGG
ncbi:MAG: hypothetical protein MAG451_03127 [Anaerolineales bacterium]|nr:hypothetical protein [Anaerolineales bacterium]